MAVPEHNAMSSSLLKLPPEIKLQIWEYAFGYEHIPLYSNYRRFGWTSYEDCSDCEACKDKGPHPSGETATSMLVEQQQDLSCLEQVPRPYQRYTECLESLFVSKTVFSEAIEMFQSTLTLHIKSPEAIALVRRSAPKSLRERATKIVLYIHFNETNQLMWCVRLLELKTAFPALTHLRVNYHMRPPVSYDNLQDVVFMYIPLLTLPTVFQPPIFVDKDISSDKPVVATTDARPGLTIHTSYTKSETLFEAHFLGLITTEDAIDEHTAVVRDLFYDPIFISSTHQLLAANRAAIDRSIAAMHLPWQSSHRDFGDPNLAHNQHFLCLLLTPHLQHELLRVARRHEKPWFEKLQRRRIVEIYVEQGAMTKQEAEVLLERQLAALPEGQGIDEFMDRLMATDDADEEGLAGALGLGGQDNWPASWQEEFQEEQDQQLGQQEQ